MSLWKMSNSKKKSECCLMFIFNPGPLQWHLQKRTGHRNSLANHESAKHIVHGLGDTQTGIQLSVLGSIHANISGQRQTVSKCGKTIVRSLIVYPCV